MKKNTKAICCLLLLVVIFSRCKKEETTSGTVCIAASVDGKIWTSSSLNTIYYDYDVQTVIAGTNTDGSTILIVFNGNVSNTGVYYLSGWDGTASYIIPGETPWSSNLSPSGGVLVITEINTIKKIMSGYFYFDAYRQSDHSTIHIDEGSFINVKYGVGIPGQPVTKNKLSVKVDGKLFKPEYIMGYEFSDFIDLRAYDANYVNIVDIYIPSSFDPGSYTIFYSGSYPYVYGFFSSGGQGGVAIGNITISKHNRMDKKIEGKFEFSTMSSWGTHKPYILTEGAFSINYQ